MIDQAAVAELIQQQITEAVRAQVSELLTNPEWMARTEKRAVDMLASRLESRIGNVNDDAELNTAVQNGVRSLFEHGFVPDIARYVNGDKFQKSVDAGVQNAVSDVIANLSLDPIWLTRVETMVNQQMHVKVNKYISELRIENTIAEAVDGALDRWLEKNPGIKTKGINDQAQQTELTIMDGTVVVEGELATSRATIVNGATIQGTLTVDDIDITGGIKVTEPAWNQISARAADIALSGLTVEWKQNLVNEISDTIKTKGMDLDQVTVGGQSLLTDGALNPNIHSSNLKILGELESLSVKGQISIKDQGSVIVIGAKDNNAWVGSQSGSMCLGIGQEAQIVLSEDGTTVVHKLKIGDTRVGFASQVPGYRGQMGDIVFNSAPAPGAPFAWQCLGAFSWQSLKVAS